MDLLPRPTTYYLLPTTMQNVSSELEMLKLLPGEEEILTTQRADLLNEEKLSKALCEAIREKEIII